MDARGSLQLAEDELSVDVARADLAEAEVQLSCIKDSISGLSTGGNVSGRVTIVVTPPAAAAFPALLKLSLCRSPGSQILTPISIIPGPKYLPPQSIDLILEFCGL